MDKKEQRAYDEIVGGIMASLNANFMSIKHHPYTQGKKTDEESAKEISDLMNRSRPVTDGEKFVAATFRWIARKQRSSFIKLMFEGRFACASLVVDDNMIPTGLNCERVFSVSSSPDGFCICEPRSGQTHRANRHNYKKTGEHSQYAQHPKNTNNVHGKNSRPDTRPPVLDDAACRDLLDELEAVDGDVPLMLDASKSSGIDLEKISVDEAMYRWMLCKDEMATDKLNDGIRKFAVDTVKLEDYIKENFLGGSCSASQKKAM